MRQKNDAQTYLSWWRESRSKTVREYQDKYNRISTVLCANPEILTLVDRDLKKLCRPGRRGRKATFTSEILLRTMLVHQLEGQSLRGTEILISHSFFLQEFVRLGPRKVPSYSLLGRALKGLKPKTWEKVNATLALYAAQEKRITPAKLRADTTVVETTIHYPTDVSLLWDGFRVLYRLLNQAREVVPGIVPSRFHDRKVKRLFLLITRYGPSKDKKRQRTVRKYKARLIEQVQRIAEVASEFVEAKRTKAKKRLRGIHKQIVIYLRRVRILLDVARRVWILGEVVPAEDRIFSLFETHTELIKRGRRHKPVEFGHKILLVQTKEKFITQYLVMRKKIHDVALPEQVLKTHESTFGEMPETLAADKGFCGDREAMNRLRKKVKVVGIPQRLRDFVDEFFVKLQQFRAGIEGSISVLKRAFRLLRCPLQGFKSFASHVGLAVFSYNLVVLARSPG
jgi:IS5 family transposase